MTDKELKCTICGGPMAKLNHIVPDIFVDINDDGEKQPLCRNCAFGILLSERGGHE